MRLKLLPDRPPEGRISCKVQRQEIYQGKERGNIDISLCIPEVARPVLILTRCYAEQTVSGGRRPPCCHQSSGGRDNQGPTSRATRESVGYRRGHGRSPPGHPCTGQWRRVKSGLLQKPRLPPPPTLISLPTRQIMSQRGVPSSIRWARDEFCWATMVLLGLTAAAVARRY